MFQQPEAEEARAMGDQQLSLRAVLPPLLTVVPAPDSTTQDSLLVEAKRKLAAESSADRSDGRRTDTQLRTHDSQLLLRSVADGPRPPAQHTSKKHVPISFSVHCSHRAINHYASGRPLLWPSTPQTDGLTLRRMALTSASIRRYSSTDNLSSTAQRTHKP